MRAPIHAPGLASTAPPTRHVFIRDLVLDASIGVYAHEHRVRQKLRINLDLAVTEEGPAAGIGVGPDELSRVLDYETLANQTRRIVAAGHVRLIETMAERIAEACLSDRRVRLVRIRVEKLGVFPDAEAAGVEIERRRPELSTARGEGVSTS